MSENVDEGNGLSGRIRLVKVAIQPMILWDDGESLKHVPLAPMDVPADDWEKYAAELWPGAVVELEKQIRENGLESLLQPADR